VRVRWNGKDDSGAIVPDGVYRLRVRFRKADRTIVIPVDIEVDSQPSAPAA
jgi:flagellar hook assembly protein FlgD